MHGKSKINKPQEYLYLQYLETVDKHLIPDSDQRKC